MKCSTITIAVCAGAMLVMTCASISRAADAQVIGHRGNPAAAPENTVASINSAFAVGVDHAEVDIALTSDGVAVCMHDGSVNRTTNGTGAISKLTLAQVKKLDAGSWFDSKFAGEKVPTLAEALIAVDKRGRLLLDVKSRNMGAAIQAAIDEATAKGGKKFTAADLWIWPGPTADYTANIKNPEYLLGSVPSQATWQAKGYFDRQKELGVVGWDVSGGKMNAAFAAAARANGMVVSVFTINSEASMKSFIKMGVTAMETDHPKRLVDLIKSKPTL